MKNDISKDTVWFSSVMSKMVPMVSLIIQNMVMLSILQPACERALAVIFGISAIVFSLSTRGVV